MRHFHWQLSLLFSGEYIFFNTVWKHVEGWVADAANVNASCFALMLGQELGGHRLKVEVSAKNCSEHRLRC